MSPKLAQADAQTKEALLEEIYSRRVTEQAAAVIGYRDTIDSYITTNLQEVREARIRENLLLSEEARERISGKQKIIDDALSKRSVSSFRPSSKFKWQPLQDSLPLKYLAMEIVERFIGRHTAKPQVNLRFTEIQAAKEMDYYSKQLKMMMSIRR